MSRPKTVKPLQWSAEALLVVVRLPDGDLESAAVFMPQQDIKDKGETYYMSAYGTVYITWSYLSPYKMMARSKSAFRTGVPLPGETFTVFPSRAEAIKEADKIYAANRRKLKLPVI